MRKISVSMLLVLFTATSFGQQLNAGAPGTADYYMAKSKKQKKIATILLVAGGGLIITALVFPKGELTHDGICIAQYCSDQYQNDGLKSGLFYAGIASALGSIPFFVYSLKNRRRSTSVGLSAEKLKSLYSGYTSSVNFPVLSAKLRF